MATTTTNYGLVKPAPTDAYDITQHNANMDKIDAELSSVQGSVSQSPFRDFQVVNSGSGNQSFKLEDFSFYLLIVTGVNTPNIGYMGTISTTGGFAYKNDIIAGKSVSIGHSGLTLTINSTAYVRVQLLRLKTS